jgi:hypothetical protein
MYSSEGNFLFIRVPKSAGRTIDKYLMPKYDKHHILFVKDMVAGKVSKHLSYTDALTVFRQINGNSKKEKSRFDSLWKFGVVRNPYDRIVSHFIGYAHKNYPELNPRNIKGMRKTMSHWVLKEYRVRNMTRSRFGTYQLFMQQYCYFTKDMTHSGKYMMDYVAKYENLAEDIQIINDRCRVDINIRDTKVGKAKYREHYSHYYTPEARYYVTHAFKQDLERWDYSFEDRT